jgi:hypothetical protein
VRGTLSLSEALVDGVGAILISAVCNGEYCIMVISVHFVERTEKVSLGSIKAVVSEPIEGHEEYHMMVGVLRC